MTKINSINSNDLPVRYRRKVDVHVHSGLPNFLAERHSRCRILPGKIASVPLGSTAAEPVGKPKTMVGGTSSIYPQTI